MRLKLWAALLATSLSQYAQGAMAEPGPSLSQASAGDPTVSSTLEADVDAFYSNRAAPLWLQSDFGRAAAAKISASLRNGALDGVPQGPDLSNKVDEALSSNEPDKDRVISSAWLRYVRALTAPTDGITFADPYLLRKSPTAAVVLNDAARAPSIVDYVDQTSAVNPLYAELRDAAISEGATADRHVLSTLQRLRLIPPKGRAVVVNVSAAELWMLEDGRPVDRMKVVVGKTTSPTPQLAGTIHYVTFNPYWHILDEVVQRKVAPAVLKRGVSYLKAARYEAVSDWATSEPVDPKLIDWKAVASGQEKAFIRQLPGPNNMMGALKISFENDFDIFLHDTPHKELFAKTRRDLSLGCVRLEHADRLAKWLLGSETTPATGQPEEHVMLTEGVPIYLLNLTAGVQDGRLVFTDDLYGIDAVPVSSASSGK